MIRSYTKENFSWKSEKINVKSHKNCDYTCKILKISCDGFRLKHSFVVMVLIWSTLRYQEGCWSVIDLFAERHNTDSTFVIVIIFYCILLLFYWSQFHSLSFVKCQKTPATSNIIETPTKIWVLLKKRRIKYRLGKISFISSESVEHFDDPSTIFEWEQQRCRWIFDQSLTTLVRPS